tara:strand:- start:1225 stop:2280 length:1056 start_codon:yes stop_codon:yes gene_type:complete
MCWSDDGGGDTGGGEDLGTDIAGTPNRNSAGYGPLLSAPAVARGETIDPSMLEDPRGGVPDRYTISDNGALTDVSPRTAVEGIFSDNPLTNAGRLGGDPEISGGAKMASAIVGGVSTVAGRGMGGAGGALNNMGAYHNTSDDDNFGLVGDLNLTRAGTLYGNTPGDHGVDEGGMRDGTRGPGLGTFYQGNALSNYNTLATAAPETMVNVSGFGRMSAADAVVNHFSFDPKSGDVNYTNTSVAPPAAKSGASEDGGSSVFGNIMDSIFGGGSGGSGATPGPTGPPDIDYGNDYTPAEKKNSLVQPVAVTPPIVSDDRFAENSTVPYQRFRRRGGSIFSNPDYELERAGLGGA